VTERRVGHGAPFVGRERELTTVVETLRAAPALLLIEGDAGVGKSRLLHEARGRTGLADDAVLHCACPPVEPQFPLGPVLEAVRRRSVSGLELSPLVGALRPLLPEWSDDLPPAPEPLPDPMATRYRLLRALSEVLDRLGVAVLVIEDGQWADPATLELALMLTSSPSTRLALAVTYLPREIPDDSLLWRLTSHSAPHLTQARI